MDEDRREMTMGRFLERIAERILEGRWSRDGENPDGENPYGRLLGGVAWRNEGGEWRKYRVVAVSHKGSVAIRSWEARAGAEWVRRRKVAQGALRFGEDGKERL